MKSYKSLTIVTLVLTALSGCLEQSQDAYKLNENHKLSTSLKSMALPKLLFNVQEHHKLVFEDSRPLIVHPRNKHLVFYDVKRKEYTDSISFPYEIEGNLNSFDVEGINDAIVWLGNTLIRSKNDTITSFEMIKELVDVRPIQYFTELDKVVFEFTNSATSTNGQYFYDYPFLTVYDLSSATFTPIALHHSQFYDRFSRGKPETYLSKTDSILIISQHRSPEVFRYNLISQQLDVIKLPHPEAKLDELIEYDLQSDNILKYWTINAYLYESYGQAFYDHQKDEFYRLFFHRLPIDSSLNYAEHSLRRFDKPVTMMIYDVKSDKMSYFDIPSNRMFPGISLNMNFASDKRFLYHLNYLRNNDAQNRSRTLDEYNFVFLKY